MTPDFAWLRDHAWPLWLAHGIDRAQGGFHEWLDPADLRCDAGHRRLRVAARQVWSFAQAARHGVPGAADAVALGLDFLRSRARLPGGGYATRFDLRGQVVDPRLDTYDNAFCLLAFAGAGERSSALEQLALFEGKLRHAAGGWREGVPDALPRQQNPHMHLLEAALEAHAAFAEPRFLDLAEELVAVFLARLWHAPSGTLPERFSDDLQPIRQAGRHAVEPGHHCEWAWLLRRHAALLTAAGRTPPAELPPLATALLRFAEAHGPGDGLLRDEVWSDGSPKSGTARLWPQAEWYRAVRTAHASAALARHLGGVRAGLWHERLDAAGVPVPGVVPASSLYHLTGALLPAAG